MKISRKAAVVAAAAAALAGTSGAALAAAGAPRPGSKVAHEGAVKAPARPAAKVTGEIEGGITGAQTEHAAVHEPGSQTVVVVGQATESVKCLTDVRAWVYSGGALAAPKSSVVDTKKIKLAAYPKETHILLQVSFPKSAAPGTWYLTEVTATACGTKPVGWNAEWQGYDGFTVKR